VDGKKTIKFFEFDSGSISGSNFEYDYECKAWSSLGLKTYKVVCSDGSYRIFDPPVLSFPLTMGLGDTFKHTSTCDEYDSAGNFLYSSNFTIHLTLEKEEVITVKAGTFNCLKFSGWELDEGVESNLDIWLARKIGEVFRKYSDGSGGLIEKRGLISFTNGHFTYCPDD